jgi:diguanylate cyclase (GGDEF)-like protein
VARAAHPLYDLFVNGITARLDVEDLRRDADRYADEAHTDPLTGLPNRRRLERFVEEIVGRRGSAVIGVGDLDRFKEVNTVHGHLVGDRVLAASAEVLSGALRSADFLARYGGDEFVVVFPDTALAEAQKIADRLTAAWSHIAPSTQVTLTMGLAELDPDLGMAEAFQKADLLMLRAKEAR